MLQALVMLAVLGIPEAARRDPPTSDRTAEQAEQFARAEPAHKLAMLEARRVIPSTDLRVVQARALLARVDALYAEDAGQIVELTELFWREIRSEGQEALAFEMLEGATAWREPAYFAGGGRRFEEYAVLYATLRIGKPGQPKATGRVKARGVK